MIQGPAPATREIGDHPDPLGLPAGRPDVTTHQGRMGGEVLVVEEPPTGGKAHLAVSRHEHYGGSSLVVEDCHRLEQIGGGHPAVGEEVHHLVDPRTRRSVVLDHRPGTVRTRRRGGVPPLGPLRRRFHVGGVAATRAGDEVVLADRGRHHELVVDVPADRASGRLDRHDLE